MIYTHTICTHTSLTNNKTNCGLERKIIKFQNNLNYLSEITYVLSCLN